MVDELETRVRSLLSAKDMAANDAAVRLADAAIAAQVRALLDRIAELEAALRRIEEGDEDRPVGTRFRQDGKSSKHDKCVHDIWMYETCGECISALARSALTLSGADGEGPRG